MNVNSKVALLLFYLVSAFSCWSQSLSYLDNDVSKLRQLEVKSIIIGTDTTHIEHKANSMHIDDDYIWYNYVFDEESEDYEPVDSIPELRRTSKDYYFNKDNTLNSVYSISERLDSNSVDTFEIYRFTYEGHVVSKSHYRSAYSDSVRYHIDKEVYYFSKDQVDSVLCFTNAIQGTFGTTYSTRLRMNRKYHYVYDTDGRKTKKERFIWRKIYPFERMFYPIEYYDYPSDNQLSITPEPKHPRSGCIVDGSKTYSSRTLITFYPNGLVWSYEYFSRIQNEGEEMVETPDDQYNFSIRYTFQE